MLIVVMMGKSAVNKQFEFLELAFDFVYVDLKYDDIYLTFTVGSVCFSGVRSHVAVFGMSVKLSWYSILLYVLHVCMLESAKVQW